MQSELFFMQFDKQCLMLIGGEKKENRSLPFYSCLHSTPFSQKIVKFHKNSSTTIVCPIGVNLFLRLCKLNANVTKSELGQVWPLTRDTTQRKKFEKRSSVGPSKITQMIPTRSGSHNIGSVRATIILYIPKFWALQIRKNEHVHAWVACIELT